VVEAGGEKVFTNGLNRATRERRDAVEVGGGGEGSGPQVEIRLDARNGGGARNKARDESDRSLVEVLAEAFVIGEEEGVVGNDSATERSTELIALERRGAALIEVISGIESGIADKFVHGTMPQVGTRLSDDNDLAARVLAELGAVGVALHVEFTDGVDAKELTAGAAGSHIVFSGAGEFDAVEQKYILLRTIAGHGEIVRGSGIGDAGTTCFLRGEIDDSRIEGEEEIIAAAIERELLDFVCADETGDIAGAGVDDGSVLGDGDGGFDLRYLKMNVDGDFLIGVQEDAGTDKVLEAGLGCRDFVKAHGEGEDEVIAAGA